MLSRHFPFDGGQIRSIKHLTKEFSKESVGAVAEEEASSMTLMVVMNFTAEWAESVANRDGQLLWFFDRKNFPPLLR